MVLERKKYRIPIVLLVFGTAFCAFSGFYAVNTSGEWFARSGAVLSFVSVVVQFFISNLKRSGIETLFKTDMGIRDKFKVIREKDILEEVVSISSIVTGLIGTIIWGYGDLFYS